MSWHDAGGLSQAPATTRINNRTQRSVVGDLGQSATGIDQQIKAVNSSTP